MCLLKKQFCAIYLLLFLSFNLVLIICCSESQPSYLKNDEDCCVLELKEILIQDGKKFIPSSAVSAGVGYDGLKKYFFVANDSYRIGMIDNSVDPSNCIVAKRSDLVDCAKGKILTNPYNCALGWKSTTGHPQETNRFAYPLINTPECNRARYSCWDQNPQFHFVRYGSKIGALDEERRNFVLIDIIAKRFSSEKLSNFEILEVDCFSSLKSQFSFELYNIVAKDDLSEEPGEYLIRDQVTNDDEQETSRKIVMSTTLTSTMQVFKERSLEEIFDSRGSQISADSVIKRVEVGGSAGFFNFFSSSGGRQDITSRQKIWGKEKHESQERGSKEGHTTSEIKTIDYRFDQEIRVKPKHQTIVSIRQKRLKGERGFTAYYRVKPITAKKMWSPKRILTSLRRFGLTEEEIVDINNSISIPINGRVKIDSGFDTHVLIESKPLGSNDPRASTFEKYVFTEEGQLEKVPTDSHNQNETSKDQNSSGGTISTSGNQRLMDSNTSSSGIISLHPAWLVGLAVAAAVLIFMIVNFFLMKMKRVRTMRVNDR